MAKYKYNKKEMTDEQVEERMFSTFGERYMIEEDLHYYMQFQPRMDQYTVFEIRAYKEDHHRRTLFDLDNDRLPYGCTYCTVTGQSYLHSSDSLILHVDKEVFWKEYVKRWHQHDGGKYANGKLNMKIVKKFVERNQNKARMYIQRTESIKNEETLLNILQSVIV